MTKELEEKGWFNLPPKRSMLRKEPACAWFTAGVTPNCQRSKPLPSLQRAGLRKAIQKWIKHHFFLPVGGIDKDGNQINLMRMFVTYVWADYVYYQKPKVPALTNVGRFIFAYIWRNQHALYR